MVVAVAVTLVRAAFAVVVVAALAGCATRFDASGNRIYIWQFGQGSQTAIDYSNPRLPVLPRNRPLESLWEIPSPFEQPDLSQYSMRSPPSGTSISSPAARVGDNDGCVGPCNSIAPPALVVSRAGDRDRSSAGR